MTTNTASKKNPNILILPPALGSYANIFVAREIEGSNSGPKFSVCLLWDKEEKGLAPLRARIEAVAVAKFGPSAKSWLAQSGGKFWNPIKDGDIEKPEDPVYKGKVFMNVSSKNAPQVCDMQLQRIMSVEDAYSGCTFRAQVGLFAFDKAGKKGVSCGLNNLQVVKKGPRIDGRQDAADAFAGFTEEADEAVDPIS